METLIQPKILKGFRDFLPESEIQRSLLIEKLTGVSLLSAFAFAVVSVTTRAKSVVSVMNA